MQAESADKGIRSRNREVKRKALKIISNFLITLIYCWSYADLNSLYGSVITKCGEISTCLLVLISKTHREISVLPTFFMLED